MTHILPCLQDVLGNGNEEFVGMDKPLMVLPDAHAIIGSPCLIPPGRPGSKNWMYQRPRVEEITTDKQIWKPASK